MGSGGGHRPVLCPGYQCTPVLGPTGSAPPQGCCVPPASVPQAKHLGVFGGLSPWGIFLVLHVFRCKGASDMEFCAALWRWTSAVGLSVFRAPQQLCPQQPPSLLMPLMETGTSSVFAR